VNQTGKHLAGLDAQFGELAVCLPFEVAETCGHRELVFHLATGSVSDIQEVQVVRLGVAGASLDDIRGHRNGCAPQLRCQPEDLLPWKATGVLVDRQCQTVGQLESPQLAVVAHGDCRL
jgi:hypothetical protein